LKRKAVLGIMLTLLFMGILSLTFDIQQVEAGGTITIKADGSVDPDTAPISTVDNVTYTFTANINDSIVVERDDIVVDGAGYTLQGTGSGYGIELSYRSNVTIKNMEIKNFWAGIQLSFTSDNTISGNKITAFDYCGIYMDLYAPHNTISGNTITAPSKVERHGIFLGQTSGNNIISGNYIDGMYEYGIRGGASSNNIISGNTIKDTFNGIWSLVVLTTESITTISSTTPQIVIAPLTPRWMLAILWAATTGTNTTELTCSVVSIRMRQVVTE